MFSAGMPIRQLIFAVVGLELFAQVGASLCPRPVFGQVDDAERPRLELVILPDETAEEEYWIDGGKGERLAELTKKKAEIGCILLGQKFGDTIAKRLRQFPTIRVVCLVGTNVSDAGIAELASHENLRDLRILCIESAEDRRMKDYFYRSLYLQHRPLRHPNPEEWDWYLRNLSKYLRGTWEIEAAPLGGELPKPRVTVTGQVSDKGIAALAACKHLERLEVWSTRVTDDGLSALSGLNELQVLDVRDTKITAAGLAHIKSEKLSELTIPDEICDDAGLEYYVRLLKPTSLSLTKPKWRIADKGLKHLADQAQIESLDLSGQDVTDDGMRFLAELNKMTLLNLSETAVGDRGLKHLAALNALETLSLRKTKITDAGALGIPRIALLQTLDLGGTSIGNKGLRGLAGSTLQSLDLSDTKISDAGFGVLAGLRLLQTLDISGTSITNAGLNKLTVNKNLRALHLADTPIKLSAIEFFSRRMPNCEIKPTRLASPGPPGPPAAVPKIGAK